jgi:ABC-2 type transport system ATP-binding protein
MLSTHIMQEVEAICQRVIIISKGRIMADDLTGNIGKHATTPHTVILELNTDPEETLFRSVDGVDGVKQLKPGTWLIETYSGKDIREDLFRLAVENKLVIRSMHAKDRKLEEVFHELTS